MTTKITSQRVSNTLKSLKARLDKEDLSTVYGRYRSYAVGNAILRWESKHGNYLASNDLVAQAQIVASLEEFISEMKDSARTWSSRGTADGYGMVARSLTRLLEKAQAK